MKPWGRLVIGALCLVGISACSQVQGYLDVVSDKGISKSYVQELKRWTRSQKAYSRFETKAHIEATLRSHDFNRSYVEEYSRIYQLNTDERKKMEVTLTAAASEFTEFIFYAYVPNKMENDFDRRGSVWSIFLVNGKGEKIAPIEVKRLDPVTPVVAEFFPYINPYYGVAYRLLFSQQLKDGHGDGPLKLVFTSVIGKVDLAFERQ